MKNRNLFIIFSLFCLISSCKKPENRKCWKFLGKESIKEISVTSFSKLKLNKHLAYVIIQDSLDKIVLRGGENMLNLVECNVNNDLLEITNTNKCNFLRNQKKSITVEIHCTNIYNIHYEGTEYLKTEGTLVSDYFVLFIRDGAGPVTMNLQSKIIDADISHGYGDYTLTGTTEFARISARSNGYCDTYGLAVSDSIYVSSETPGIIKIQANGIPIRGYSKGTGDIWYKGSPTSIDVILNSTGKVLDKN